MSGLQTALQPPLSKYSFTHSFILQIFSQSLLRARQCSSARDTAVNTRDMVSVLMGCGGPSATGWEHTVKRQLKK